MAWPLLNCSDAPPNASSHNMKLHLLLLFLLAAPVISRVLSLESAAPSDTPPAVTSPTAQPVSAAALTPALVPGHVSVTAPVPRSLPRIPACHAFTFM